MANAPRYTVRGILLATFWVAVFLSAVMLLRRVMDGGKDWQARGLPASLRLWVALGAYWLGLMSPILAAWTMTGRQRDYVRIGLLSFLMAVLFLTVTYW